MRNKTIGIVFFRGNSIFVYFSLKVLLCPSKHSGWCPTQMKGSILVGGREEQAQTASNSTNQVTWLFCNTEIICNPGGGNC